MNTLNRLLLYVLFLFVAIIQCCSNKPVQSNNTDSISRSKKVYSKPNPVFKEFLKKFKILKFPLNIRTLEIAVDSSKKLNRSDNGFIKSPYTDEIYAYGVLPDTAVTFKIIWLQPAEVEVPVLTTFTKDGKKINEAYLGVGGCGSDCCFACKEFIEIKNDLTIFSVDSIKSCKCDSNGPKANTTKKYIRYKTGKILNDGKINMTAVLEKPY